MNQFFLALVFTFTLICSPHLSQAAEDELEYAAPKIEDINYLDIRTRSEPSGHTQIMMGFDFSKSALRSDGKINQLFRVSGEISKPIESGTQQAVPYLELYIDPYPVLKTSSFRPFHIEIERKVDMGALGSVTIYAAGWVERKKFTTPLAHVQLVAAAAVYALGERFLETTQAAAKTGFAPGELKTSAYLNWDISKNVAFRFTFFGFNADASEVGSSNSDWLTHWKFYQALEFWIKGLVKKATLIVFVKSEQHQYDGTTLENEREYTFGVGAKF